MKCGSDNQAGASPRVMAALAECNAGYEHSYGTDTWTARAVEALRRTFDCDLEAYFVATGTAANSLALACLAQPWNAILCHDQSHILLDELTAPEFFTGGARLIGISRGAGKIEPAHLEHHLQRVGRDPPHNPAASVLSLTQCSENGLVYTPQELTELHAAAGRHGLRMHMDGARFANAVVSLGCRPGEISWRAGIDVLCLGATKNGALGAEAVVFFDRALAEHFDVRRKRAGHLVSKSRFLAAQFVGWLQDDHWLELARHANAQAARLAKALMSRSFARLVWPAVANEVFAVLPQALAQTLRDTGAEFYEWPASSLPQHISLAADEVLVRLVASFMTGDPEVEQFCSIVAAFEG